MQIWMKMEQYLSHPLNLLDEVIILLCPFYFVVTILSLTEINTQTSLFYFHTEGAKVCKNTYPAGYWKKCKDKFGYCNRLKRNGKCAWKWKNVLTGACKRQVGKKLGNRRVNEYCRATCPGCSKKPFLNV